MKIMIFLIGLLVGFGCGVVAIATYALCAAQSMEDARREHKPTNVEMLKKHSTEDIAKMIWCPVLHICEKQGNIPCGECKRTWLEAEADAEVWERIDRYIKNL